MDRWPMLRKMEDEQLDAWIRDKMYDSYAETGALAEEVQYLLKSFKMEE
jgi:hypothetical protein